MKLNYIQIFKQKSGVAIMSVMLFFIVMMIMVGALTISSMGNSRLAGVNSDSIAAYYAAEAGITSVVNEFLILKESTSLTADEIKVKLNEIKDKYHDKSLLLHNNNGLPVTVDIFFEKFEFPENNTFKLTVVSAGQVNNFARTLEVSIDFDYGNSNIITEEFQVRHAVLVRENIKTGNGTIQLKNDNVEKPKIATISSANNSIVMEGIRYPDGLEIELTNPQDKCNDNLVVDSSHRCLVNKTVLVTEMRETTLPEIRVNFPVINFTPIRGRVSSITSSAKKYDLINNTIFNTVVSEGGNYEIKYLNFKNLNGSDYEIDKDIFIITNELTLGSVNFSGNGMLTIYVKPGSNSFIHDVNNVDFGRYDEDNPLKSNEEKLAIYVDTISGVANSQFHVSFPNGSSTRGYFMFENARVQFLQNSKLYGSVFTGAFEGSSSNINAVRLQNNAKLDINGGRSLIVAPNGKVHMVNNSSLTGAVIAKNFEQDNGGNSLIQFDPDFPQKIPFEIASPIESIVVPDTNEGSRDLIIHSTRER